MELSSWRREVPFGAYLQPIHLTVVGPVAKGSTNAPVAAVGGSSPGISASLAGATAGLTEQDGGLMLETNGGDPATPTPQSDSTATCTPLGIGGAEAPTAAAAVPTPTAAVAEEANEVLSTPKRLKRRQKPAPPTTPNGKPSELYEEEVKVIPPFESERIQSSSDSSNSNPSSSERMVMNVGGPVWALDWVPQDTSRRRKRKPVAAAASAKKKGANSAAAVSNGGGDATATGDNNNDNGSDSEREDDAAVNRREMLAKKWRFLALATHPPCKVLDGELVKKTPPDHYYNAEEAGARSLIQIWAVPVESKKKNALNVVSKASSSSARKPKLVYGIDHHSGVAWDLQWCPTVHAMPRRIRSENLLGVLAVCFGDGSLQVFEVPEIAPELLTAQGLRKHEARVEKLRPTINAKVPRILQLSVQWSPHRWNLLLTGGSDGSVSLWNLEYELSKPEEPIENASDSPVSSPPLPMEPQRRFQDVDTVGKQEAFDWGWGWVALRSVSWSPFDEFIFATTGNDSIFKVWDIREPRICFRSHRIRSTWGLSLQWMDHTTIQISGDQGSIYMYDTLSGSCQKLHYHPQIDSPVWDLQFARRGGNVPLLASCCTSGSVRVAPAKKLFRAPQHSIEFCRLSGEKDASVDREFKALTVNLEQKVVLGTAESASPATRQFCERDAALHRLRMSTSATGSFPCFLAVGGHAGLVVILEIQEALDHLLENYFVSATRKLGRPRRRGVTSPWSAAKTKRKNKKQQLAVLVDGAAGISSKKARGPNKKRGSHIKSKKMHNALTKYSNKTKKTNGKKVSGATAPPEKESEFPQFEMKTDSEEEENEDDDEAEDEDDSEEESDSGLALMMAEEHSDDERISYSDGDMADEEEYEQQRQMFAQFNPESARMRSEYQLDLSEEDAIMLAIHMSELEQVQASPPQKPFSTAAKAKVKSPAAPSSNAAAQGGKKPTASSTSSAKPPSTQKKKPQQQKKKNSVAEPNTTGKDTADEAGVAELSTTATASGSGAAPATTWDNEGKKKPIATSSSSKPQSAQKKPKQQKKKMSTPAGVLLDTTAKDNPKAAGKAKAKDKAPSSAAATTTTAAAAKPSTGKKAQPKKTGSSKSSNRAPQGAMLDGFEGYIMDQATTLQIIQMQNGMTEEDALIEAIHMSEIEAMRASFSVSPTKEIDGGGDEVMQGTPKPVGEATTTPVASTEEGKSSESSAAGVEQPVVTTTTENEVDVTVRRLEFTPLAKSTAASTESAVVSGSESQEATIPPTDTTAVSATTTAEDTGASSYQDPAAPLAPVASNAKSVKPKPRPVSTGKKKAPAVKAPKTSAAAASPPNSSVALATGDDSVAVVTVEVPTESASGDAMGDTPPPPPTAASEMTSDTAAAAPLEDSHKLKAKAKAASNSSAGKRKRSAAKAPPRKRPSAKAGSSSRTERAGTGQEESGYLTDEEALYLALRASEVEY